MGPGDFPAGDDHVGRAFEGPRAGRDDARTAVWLRGEHDLTTAGVVSTALTEAIALDDADVVVDLTDVEFMDASTLGVFARGRELLAVRGRRLTVRSPQRLARRVLEVCGLGDLIEVPPAGAPPAGGGARTALETWVEVPPAGRGADIGPSTERITARDDPEASRR